MPPSNCFLINEITFSHEESIPISATQQAAVAEHWRVACDANPGLFKGPIVNPLSVNVSGGRCTVRWHQSDFAHYHYSRANPGEVPVATLFVSVAIPTDEGLVVGRMSQTTSTPGVIQLPGGGVSIGPDKTRLLSWDLVKTAVQEVREELGTVLEPADLQIRGVITRQGPLDVGVLFLAQPRSWGVIQERFMRHRTHELQAGINPEFDDIFTIPLHADPTKVGDSEYVVDYLPAVVASLSAARADIS